MAQGVVALFVDLNEQTQLRPVTSHGFRWCGGGLLWARPGVQVKMNWRYRKVTKQGILPTKVTK
jgi:hypothetical protein